MKLTLTLLIVAAVFGCALSCSVEDFEAYKIEYNKVYADEAENNKHMETYCKNVKSIEEHNKKYAEGETTYEQGINQFTDLSPEEFKGYFGGFKGLAL